MLIPKRPRVKPRGRFFLCFLGGVYTGFCGILRGFFRAWGFLPDRAFYRRFLAHCVCVLYILLKFKFWVRRRLY